MRYEQFNILHKYQHIDSLVEDLSPPTIAIVLLVFIVNAIIIIFFFVIL